MKAFEAALRRAGYDRVAGVDEAGRGPLAGPVAAAAVVMPSDWRRPAGLADSKALSERQRLRLFRQIMSTAQSVGIGIAGLPEIEAHNILQASRLAMALAVGALRPAADFLLVDGLLVPELGIAQRAIVAGDTCCASIAAASIIAKVTRDRLMHGLDSAYRGYGFGQHKGYATAQHLRAIEMLGPCSVHRATFAPVAAQMTIRTARPPTRFAQAFSQVCISD
jgi:ribonuclease HII